VVKRSPGPPEVDEAGASGASWAVDRGRLIVFARVATFEGGDVEELRRLNDERMAEGSAGLPDGLERAA
jgi:hypothetical protein